MNRYHNGLNGCKPGDYCGHLPNTTESLTHQDCTRMLKHLNVFIEYSPDYVPALTARGLLHCELGDNRRAAKDFSRVINLEPGNAKAHHYRGFVRAQLGEHRLAVEDYDITIRLAPDNGVAHDNRGESIAELGDPARAVADFDAAIALDPDDAQPHINKGAAPTSKWAPRHGRWRASAGPLTWTPVARRLPQPWHSLLQPARI